MTIRKEQGDVALNVLGKSVHDANDVRSEIALGALDSSPNLALIDQSARNYRHNSIIARMVLFWRVMRDALIFVLLVAVCVLGWMVHAQTTSISALQSEVHKLEAKTELKPVASLELQEKCAAQARKEYNASGWNDNKEHPMAGFTNHYNMTLGKCFMVVEDTSEAKPRDGTFFKNKYVTDAFEGKSYAEYAWKSDKVKKYWEVKPFVCKVTLPSAEDKNCESSDEWEELVKAYMQ